MRKWFRCILSLTTITFLIGDFNSSVIFAQSIPDESTSTHKHQSHPQTIQLEGQTDTRSGIFRELSDTGSPVFQKQDWPSPVMDEENHGFFLADVLEYRPNIGGDGSHDDYRWDIEGWYGGDYNRIWFKSEGQRDTAFKADYDIDSQLLFGRFIQQYYDFQVGGRVETQSYRGRNVTRGLAVIGLQGLVPYNYELQPAIFISQHGDLSARLTMTKDLSLTQRLILQPRFETNAAIQRVRKFTTGSGLNNLELGFRLRYEIRREFAPYVGISLDKSFGDTALLVREEGGNSSQIRFVVGVRLWF